MQSLPVVLELLLCQSNEDAELLLCARHATKRVVQQLGGREALVDLRTRRRRGPHTSISRAYPKKSLKLCDQSEGFTRAGEALVAILYMI